MGTARARWILASLRDRAVSEGPRSKAARHLAATCERGVRKGNSKQVLWNFRVRPRPTLKPSGEESAFVAESSPGRISQTSCQLPVDSRQLGNTCRLASKSRCLQVARRQFVIELLLDEARGVRDRVE